MFLGEFIGGFLRALDGGDLLAIHAPFRKVIYDPLPFMPRPGSLVDPTIAGVIPGSAFNLPGKYRTRQRPLPHHGASLIFHRLILSWSMQGR